MQLDDLLECLGNRRDDPSHPLPPELGDLGAWRGFLITRGAGEQSIGQQYIIDDDEGLGGILADRLATGFYDRRLVKGGPKVPVCIFRQGRHWMAWIDDEVRNITDDPFFFADAITESQFYTMHIDRIEALRRGDYDHHRVATRVAVDLTKTILI